MLDLHRLWLLHELQQRGTIAAVAAAHSYSPSAVSQQLKQLTTEAGVPLLEPVGRGVRLTRPAERLVEHTSAILALMEQARADLDASAEILTGTVRLAAFQTAAHTLVPSMLTALRASQPELRIELGVQEPEVSLPGLLAHEFDLVLLEDYPGLPQHRWPGLEYRPLATDPLRLAQPAGTTPASISGLGNRRWVMEPRGSLARAWATGICRAAGFEPNVCYETADLLLHARLVRTGHAIALLPALLTTEYDPTIQLTDLPGMPTRRISIATRRGASSHPALNAVNNALAHAISIPHHKTTPKDNADHSRSATDQF